MAQVTRDSSQYVAWLDIAPVLLFYTIGLTLKFTRFPSQHMLVAAREGLAGIVIRSVILASMQSIDFPPIVPRPQFAVLQFIAIVV